MTDQLRTRPEPILAAPDLRRAATPGRPRVAALAVVFLLAAVGLAAVLTLRPPESRPASAPATQFSAGRAMALLPAIASVPHPTGSPANAAVRRYLVDTLRGLGLQPEVQTRVVARTRPPPRPTVGTVSNVHARIAGSRPTGRVLLVAHYDSVPTGPGAADDGANVAAILEVVRALRAGPQPRNDIDILFTDGEEQGLLGAQAFVDSGAAGDPRRVVAVNLEARGASGPAVLFQTAGPGLAASIRAADPVTTSLAEAVYRLLPHDTDLTAFDQAGMRGLNLAFIEGAGHYHTAHDDVAHVSANSVQHQGETTLALVRHLAGADLTTGDGAKATYFSLFGAVLTYPNAVDRLLAGLAAAGYLALLWTGRRRGLSLRGVGRSAGTFAVVTVAATAIGIGSWLLLRTLRPETRLAAGVPGAGWYVAAQLALLIVVLLAWYRWARRRASPVAVAAGVLGWFTGLALLLAVLLPGGAYLFTWPALVGVAALAAALRLAPPESPLRTLAGYAAAVPAVALILPVTVLLVPALGLSSTVPVLLFAAVLAASAATVLEALPRRRWLAAGAVVALAVAVTTAATWLGSAGYTTTRPRPVSLAYALETDTGTASWVSEGGPGQPAVGRLLTDGPARLDDRIPTLARRALTTGPAPVVPGLPGPQLVESTVDARDGVREIRLRLRVPADAYRFDVFTDTTAHEILSATVDGMALPGGRNVPDGTGAWRWGFRYAAAPADGVEVRLRARGSGPLPIRVVSTATGLPAGAGAPALGPGLSWASWPGVSGETLVVRTFRL